MRPSADSRADCLISSCRDAGNTARQFRPDRVARDQWRPISIPSVVVRNGRGDPVQDAVLPYHPNVQDVLPGGKAGEVP